MTKVTKSFEEHHYSDSIRKDLMELFNVIDVNELISSSLIQKTLNCSESTARRFLKRLKEMNLIESIAKAGKGKYMFKSQVSDV